MKIFNFSLLALFCIFCSSESESQFLSNKLFKIAKSHQFPFQVGILVRHPIIDGQYVEHHREITCDGVLLSENRVLTSAECLKGSTSEIVVLGAHFLAAYEKSQIKMRIKSNDIKIHPNYRSKVHKNNIAMIRLPKNVEFNEFIQPIKLSDSNDDHSEGEKVRRVLVIFSILTFSLFQVIVSGWGIYSLSGSSGALRYYHDKILSYEECQTHFKEFIHNYHICLAGLDIDGPCLVDFGVPMTVEKDGEFVIIGIVGAQESCRKSTPSIFTKITSSDEFIRANLDSW